MVEQCNKLDMESLPDKSLSFYLKYSDQAKTHVLEKAVQRRLACEKCPYVTMKKTQFENHVSVSIFF